MDAKKTKIESWASALTTEQMKTLIVELVQDGMVAETISFYNESDSIAPYWSSCGEPLVPGQQTHIDE